MKRIMDIFSLAKELGPNVAITITVLWFAWWLINKVLTHNEKRENQLHELITERIHNMEQTCKKGNDEQRNEHKGHTEVLGKIEGKTKEILDLLKDIERAVRHG